MMALRLTTSQVPPQEWRGAEEREHRWRYRSSDHTEPHGERVHEEWRECVVCGEIEDADTHNDICAGRRQRDEIQQSAQTDEMPF